MAHTFRVHFEVGTPLDFQTETAAQDRDKALAERAQRLQRLFGLVYGAAA